MTSRQDIENEAEMIMRLAKLQNPTGGNHTPTPWQKKEFKAFSGEGQGIADAEGNLIAMFKRRDDRDLALYFANTHNGMIDLLRNLAQAFEFIALAHEENPDLNRFASEHAQQTRIYADLFCRLGEYATTSKR